MFAQMSQWLFAHLRAKCLHKCGCLREMFAQMWLFAHFFFFTFHGSVQAFLATATRDSLMINQQLEKGVCIRVLIVCSGTCFYSSER